MIRIAAALAAVLLVVPRLAGAQGSFVNFESGHVRPLALSPDGSRLFAVNTPDNRLAIYDITAGGLTLAAEVPVGLEPVAVAARSNTEVWVVNHLSDSLSIVTVDANPALSRVTRTIHTCDEPRDLVFAGAGASRAFVTAARRGQNCLQANGTVLSPALTTAGVGRTVVQAFDAGSLGAALGGTPIATLVLFGDTPRALAVNGDGSLVYAAVFHSGNRTATVTEQAVSSGGGVPPPPPGSTANAPDVGLIVKWDDTVQQFRDELGRNWNGGIGFRLPDNDVFIIDADATPPVLASAPNTVTGVGTILFSMAVRPGNEKLFVGNTEALNEVRFEPMVNGHLHESHVTVVDPVTGTAVPHHLNPHIDYGVVPGPPGESVTTLAFPTAVAFSSDGSQLFVAGLGSGKVGALDASDLESGVITKALVPVGVGATNGGPSGLAFDGPRNRLYVMNRFDHAVSVVSNATTVARAQTAVVPLRFDPSPTAARAGRRLLYDAAFTSSHGDSACASCHVFGDFDSLAWDLGDPFGQVVSNPVPFRLDVNPGQAKTFHPMKGPMTTQSLRGMAGVGAMHWRGDRNNPADPFDEDGAFKQFNPAFVGLLGRSSQLTPGEMQSFTDFILTVQYPPNPIKAITNLDSAAEGPGRTFFNNTGVDGGVLTCEFCHRNPLGADGRMSFEGEPQEFKIAHLRNMYQKVGMFGLAGQNLGNQVRGFGFLHDGSVDTVFDFLQAPVFQFANNTQRRNVEAHALSFDTGLRPAVGQQVSATSSTFADANVIARIDLLIARANAGDCNLVVKGNFGGAARGALYVGSDSFQPDRNADALVTKTALRTLAGTAGQEQVYTCVPPGSGTRIGIDRDLDGFFDRTEIEAGSDPANPLSTPGAGTTTTTTTTTSTTTSTTTTTSGPTTTTTSTTTTSTTSTTGAPTTTTTSSTSTTTTSLPGPGAVLIQTTSLRLRDDSATPNPKARKVAFKSTTATDPPANRIVPPGRGSADDPTQAGGAVFVYNSAGTHEMAIVNLPASGWLALGSTTSPKGFKYRDASVGAPIRKVLVRADKIVVKGGGGGFGYTLNEASQGSVAVYLLLGNAAWCAEAGRPPFMPTTDFQDRYVAAPRTPAPAVCPAP
jgi:sugar lactone lactonase YvrE